MVSEPTDPEDLLSCTFRLVTPAASNNSCNERITKNHKPRPSFWYSCCLGFLGLYLRASHMGMPGPRTLLCCCCTFLPRHLQRNQTVALSPPGKTQMEFLTPSIQGANQERKELMVCFAFPIRKKMKLDCFKGCL